MCVILILYKSQHESLKKSIKIYSKIIGDGKYDCLIIHPLKYLDFLKSNLHDSEKEILMYKRIKSVMRMGKKSHKKVYYIINGYIDGCTEVERLLYNLFTIGREICVIYTDYYITDKFMCNSFSMNGVILKHTINSFFESYPMESSSIHTTKKYLKTIAVFEGKPQEEDCWVLFFCAKFKFFFKDAKSFYLPKFQKYTNGVFFFRIVKKNESEMEFKIERGYFVKNFDPPNIRRIHKYKFEHLKIKIS